MEPVKYLTVDHVIGFHDDALREFGGLSGIRSPHALASAVLQPQQSAFGQDAYLTIPEKAAAYGYFIAEAQAFNDGNKRTAAMALEAFLLLNYHEFYQDDDEIAAMFEAIGSRTVNQGEFFGWVCNHAKRTAAAGS
jgi:death on curing protein